MWLVSRSLKLQPDSHAKLAGEKSAVDARLASAESVAASKLHAAVSEIHMENAGKVKAAMCEGHAMAMQAMLQMSK